MWIFAYVIPCKTIAATQKHFKTFNLAGKLRPDTYSLFFYSHTYHKCMNELKWWSKSFSAHILKCDTLYDLHFIFLRIFFYEKQNFFPFFLCKSFFYFCVIQLCCIHTHTRCMQRSSSHKLFITDLFYVRSFKSLVCM